MTRVHLSPGVHLSGNVRVSKRSWLGTGVNVWDKLSIGDDVIVGVGSVVVQDIIEQGIYAGVPSKLIKKNKLSSPKIKD